MSVIAVIGAQWGDEGKGRIVDLLAERAKIVARFSGGDNAGHTVINSRGEFRLHLVPSGICYPQTTCIIGNGVVVNPEKLLKEIEELEGCGVAVSRLVVSDRAHLVMPYHILMDKLEEERRGKGSIGTTGRGNGPAFADKAARMGIRMGDLRKKADFCGQLQAILDLKNAILTRVYGVPPVSCEEIYRKYCSYGDQLSPFIRETTSLIRHELSQGGLVLLEGAQGALLDPDFGTYPYVTSSSPLAGGISSGTGISPREIEHVLGVFKAYVTRVGSGPMPTELKDSTGDLIRKKGNEYGTTTGRPRRCGWFDAVAGRFSVEINGFDDIALTHISVFDKFPSLKICTAYRFKGENIQSFPGDSSMLEQCQPVYEELPGWQSSTGDIREFACLPPQARNYVARLEELLSCPISLVSTGPRREQMIEARPCSILHETALN